MLCLTINNAVRLVAAVAVALAFSPPAAASPLVTGNGFGFAVVAPETGVATKFYPHPHSFVRPDPASPLSEGIATANFIKTLGWGEPGRAGAAQFVEDSHVIRLHRGDGSGYFFMPFGFERPALIVSWEPTGQTPAAWRVEWNRPIRSQTVLSTAGTHARLLRFDGIEESLLLIALGGARHGTAPLSGPLAASPAWALISLEREREAEPAIREFVRWRAGLSPRELATREIAEMEQWRARPGVVGNERPSKRSMTSISRSSCSRRISPSSRRVQARCP